MSGLADFLRSPGPTATAGPSISSVQAATRASEARETLILFGGLGLLAVVIVACSLIHRPKVSRTVSQPESAPAEPASVSPASVFGRTVDDLVNRRLIEQDTARRAVRRAFRRVCRSFALTMLASPLLNFIYLLVCSTDYFLRHYAACSPNFNPHYYQQPGVELLFFHYLPELVNIYLLFAWLPFALRLFARRRDYRNLAGKPNGPVRSALYIAVVCVLAFAVNLILRMLLTIATTNLRLP